MTDPPAAVPDAPPRLSRGFTFRSALSLAFADVSPIAAVYAIFTLGLFAAGPKFFWAFPIVLLGQLLVAAVFGELASRWPYAGSVYQWSRHVRGTTAGWVAAWAYMWGLTIALGTLSYAASGFLLQIFGVVEPSRWQTASVAILIIALGTVVNMVGRRVLKIMVVASITCEIIGSVGLGIVLLAFYRENPFSALFSNAGIPDAASWTSGPMLLAIAFVGWSFLGFEAAGSVAEEVEDPERNVPKAIILGLLLVGIVVMFSSAALILAIPNLDEVVAAQTGDVVAETLTVHLGAGITKPLLAMFVIGFISSFLAVQAAVSRCIWGAARDRSLPGSTLLGGLAGPERLPVNAIGLTALVAIVFILLAGSEFYNVLVNFNIIGFYIAFGVPVIGAAIARLTGKWKPGPFTLGRWGAPVTYVASLWIVFETVNVAWPRTQPGQPWYINWASVLTTVVLAVVGAVIYLTVRRNITAPIGERLAAEDAHPADVALPER
ncbi:APC family permease [Mycolicibacterium grossiae]|uniref:Amino acid transporter n=1 Tax=Mycolicibacterium grossiae TaxID=1552759 RepID=A0A1E8Q7F1_9MYCO|nr:amino acid permease [Mycolicibacterium grossiae]OFJ54375.1 amino acid transporter [Mycolicibacterium grossiae]QEM45445.1 amino acid permease [Mycolicibacterium grossiae]